MASGGTHRVSVIEETRLALLTVSSQIARHSPLVLLTALQPTLIYGLETV